MKKPSLARHPEFKHLLRKLYFCHAYFKERVSLIDAEIKRRRNSNKAPMFGSTDGLPRASSESTLPMPMAMRKIATLGELDSLIKSKTEESLPTQALAKVSRDTLIKRRRLEEKLSNEFFTDFNLLKVRHQFYAEREQNIFSQQNESDDECEYEKNCCFFIAIKETYTSCFCPCSRDWHNGRTRRSG
jgi:hypothetical protein